MLIAVKDGILEYMDTEKWKAFLAIADFGSLSAAADKLNISQSGLSYIIKQLENEAGFQLFTRSQWQGMTLTAGGHELYSHVAAFINSGNSLQQYISLINDGLHGELHIATYESLALSVLPHVIKSFREKHPGVMVFVEEGDNHSIELALKRNRVDFALTSKRERTGMQWIKLIDDPIRALINTDNHLAGTDEVLLTELMKEPFIMCNNVYDYDIHAIMSNNCLIPENIVCYTQNDHNVLELVSLGLGCSLLFNQIVVSLKHYDNVAIKSVAAISDDSTISRELGIVTRKIDAMSPAAKLFIREIRNFVNR